MTVQNGDDCRRQKKDCGGEMLIHSGRPSTVPYIEVRELIEYLG
jgi:hypothetical protein